MNELKLQHLLARHPTTDMDKLELTKRIKSEHLFQSVEECVEYLTKIVVFVSVNPDSPSGPNMNTFRDAPVLAINVIDEAVCSLIYEIYQQINCKDPHMLAHIQRQISDVIETINYTEHPKMYTDIKNALYNMMVQIYLLSFPVKHKEEDLPGKLSYYYYRLMYTLYNTAKPRDEYFDKFAKYYASKYE